MKRFSYQQKISWSLLAVLVVSPFTSVHAAVTISGNSQLNGGMQINAPTTLNIQGSTTIIGNVTVTEPLTIVPDSSSKGNAFSQTDFSLIPSQQNARIDLGGVTTGIVTVGNTNVDEVLGADGIGEIKSAPGVPEGQVTLGGEEIDNERQAVQDTISQTSMTLTGASEAQTNFGTEGGDMGAAEYVDVSAAITTLKEKLKAAENLLDKSGATLLELQAAKSGVMAAQSSLQAKKEQLDIATTALKDYAAALALAKTALRNEIASVDVSTAQTALDDFVSAHGDTGLAVYTDVEAAIQDLNSKKAEGQTVLNASTSTLAEVQAATTAISGAQTVLTSKKTLLATATQELVDLAQAKTALSNAIASVDVSAAQAALDAYEALQGDTGLPIYTDVEAAIQNLNSKKSSGEAVLSSSTVLAELQAATQAISAAQTELNGKVVLLDAATQAAEQVLTDAKEALNDAIAAVDVTEAQEAQTAYTEKGGVTTENVYTDVTTAIVLLQQVKDEAKDIDLATAKLADIVAATQLIEGAKADLDTKVDALKVATENLVLNEVVSKEITKFDFSTIYAGQAKIKSFPITNTNFQNNPKHFTVSDGDITVNVDLTWNIPLNGFTSGQVVGSAVDSFIQQYYNDHHIDLGQRTMAGIGFDDTFSVTRFQTGSSNVITVGGADWDEFFETNTATGSDTDTSQNRTFTVSDGTKTATITLEWKLDGMDDLIDTINDELSSAGVLATAVKESASTFKIVAKKASITITTSGADSNLFF